MNSFRILMLFQVAGFAAGVFATLVGMDQIKTRHKDTVLLSLSMAGSVATFFSIIVSCLTEYGNKKDLERVENKADAAENKADAAGNKADAAGTGFPANFGDDRPPMTPAERDAIVEAKRLEMVALRGAV
jgi:hypothetical protein